MPFELDPTITMRSPCKHQQPKPSRGTIHVEIRRFGSKSEDNVKIINEMECSQCFVESVHRIQTQSTKSTHYYDPPTISTITLPTPTSYDELQQFLAIALPINFGPALIESSDGKQIPQISYQFNDGDKIVCRQIYPSSEKDMNIQQYYKDFDGVTFNDLCSK